MRKLMRKLWIDFSYLLGIFSLSTISLCIFNLGILSLSIFSPTVFACTDFRIQAQDGSILITRSMEFALDLNSNLRSSPKGRNFENKTPEGKPAHSWKSKYGYLYVDALNIPLTVDGINEKGLSFEYLYLPNETQYQTIPKGEEKKAIPYYSFGDWVLGNFATVAEVRSALQNVYFYEQKLPNTMDTIFPLHAAIYDTEGNSIVVEFIDGKMQVHENKLGILTNSPRYDWHLSNLRNYVYLSPYFPDPVTKDGITFVATGQGSGMIGLPGDVSPPSRFVKTIALTKTALPVKDANEALNLGQHVINNVDIPRGFVRAKDKNKGTETIETTQWVVFKDLTNKKFYYRTYDNMTIQAVSMSDIDLSENGKELKMPLAKGNFIQDVTTQFKSSAPN